jgi:hypothetical protein
MVGYPLTSTSQICTFSAKSAYIFEGKVKKLVKFHVSATFLDPSLRFWSHLGRLCFWKPWRWIFAGFKVHRSSTHPEISPPTIISAKTCIKATQRALPRPRYAFVLHAALLQDHAVLLRKRLDFEFCESKSKFLDVIFHDESLLDVIECNNDG